MDRRRTAVSALAIALMLLSSTLPWWGAGAALPQDGSAGAELRLYSFTFHTPAYSCVAVLLFYSYGACPLLGEGIGLASLSFYLFWALAFLAASLVAQTVELASEVSGSDTGVLGWVGPVSFAFLALSLASFLGAVYSGRIEFVGPDPLYGSSSVLAWSVREGFFFALGAAAVELYGALTNLRGPPGPEGPRSSRISSPR